MDHHRFVIANASLPKNFGEQGRAARPPALLLKGRVSETDDDVLHEQENFRIRLADRNSQRSKANLLIKRMYSWRGYKITNGVASRKLDQITLVAYRKEQLFGTLTVALDCGGLQVDQLYGSEVDALRSEGRTLCECTRLAVDPEYSCKEALAALMNLAIVYAFRVAECDDMLIEVNPRHAGFYKRKLGFVEAGSERMCPRVNAPAVLLRLIGAYATEQIDKHGGHQTTGTKSLYPYFFSKREEEGLCARLRQAGYA
jgi:hypothetical protein